MKKARQLVFSMWVLTALLAAVGSAQTVIISEIAWMGTTTSTSDEWIELHNPAGTSVDVTGWTLSAADGTPSITLSGTVAAYGYFVLERTDDSSVPEVTADQIYSGALENGGEVLELRDAASSLIDSVDAWHGGDNATKASMSRISSLGSGTDPANWESSTIGYSAGLGTPGSSNGDVVISEIAWMGTTYSTSDEWIELHNPTANAVTLSGWTLAAVDGTPTIPLSGSIPAGGYFLLERTDDTSVPGVTADLIYSGALENGGEVLQLTDGGSTIIDETDAWHAGDNGSKATMERVVVTAAGTDPAAWGTATAAYDGGLGTPATGVPGGGGGGVGTGSDWYDVFFSDHTNTVLPGSVGPSATAQALIAAIDGAATTIEFALYGVGGSQGVIDALAAASNRGVVVRGVMDNYASGWFPYIDSQTLIDALPSGSVVLDNDDRIMHNKFLVIDDQWVWTGSGNVSDTGIYVEYNSNWSILIDSADLAAAYKTEFEEMYAGSFHDAKTDNTPHTFPPLADGTTIESYFGPSDDAKTNAIIPAIDAATSTLDVRIFYFTEAAIRDAVIAAHNRGVSVRVIVDASSAENEYSVHQDLRDAGVPVKVEDWGGKEHMKALAADGTTVIIGSQNWTISGNTDSDENTLLIANTVLANAFHTDFGLQWNSIPAAWLTADPGAESVDSSGSVADFIDNDHDGLTDEGAPEALNTVSTAQGAINVYFNKSALESTSQGSLANHSVNLEDRLVARIDAATSTVDIATYELNLPGIVDALLAQASAGTTVRMIADAKDYLEGESSNYDLFVMTMERLVRGLDGTVGTGDDVLLFADSPVFAVEDTAKRTAEGLPATPTGFTQQTLTVGSGPRTGYVIALGEKKNSTDYYAPGPQMHNKFVVLDGTWIWTGSWNFTMNGLYGADENRALGILGGNSNHGIEINAPQLADIYIDEFEEMWGSSGSTPDPDAAAFHGRKTDNTLHVVTVGNSTVEVYFSPGDDALSYVRDLVDTTADLRADFCAFTWSDQGLVDSLKLLYEGSTEDLVGTPTGFSVQGVFDSLAWNQWWSASVDMTGRTASQSSQNNPNTRWANPAPVLKDDEDTVLHHKYLVIDGHTTSDPAVVAGSTNWSQNGNTINDENLLIIHDADIADQFLQEFHARYYQAGGALP